MQLGCGCNRIAKEGGNQSQRETTCKQVTFALELQHLLLQAKDGALCRPEAWNCVLFEGWTDL